MDFVVVVNHFAIGICMKGGSLVLGGGRSGQVQRRGCALTTRSVDNSIVWLPGLGRAASNALVQAPSRIGGRSWLNVRRDQKYKSEESCEEETQLNAVRLHRQRRLPRPSPNPR